MNDPIPHPDAALDALFALARARRADTAAAEYAFETRLMARLRASRGTDFIWARVSWRMLPFFAVCVLALAVWHEQLFAQVQDAEQMAYVDNSPLGDNWSMN
jgi:uncharacterized membrane protein